MTVASSRHMLFLSSIYAVLRLSVFAVCLLCCPQFRCIAVINMKLLPSVFPCIFLLNHGLPLSSDFSSMCSERLHMGWFPLTSGTLSKQWKRNNYGIVMEIVSWLFVNVNCMILLCTFSSFCCLITSSLAFLPCMCDSIYHGGCHTTTFSAVGNIFRSVAIDKSIYFHFPSFICTFC